MHLVDTCGGRRLSNPRSLKAQIAKEEGELNKLKFDVRPSKLTKSQIYLELVPLINSEQVELPNHKRLIAQLCGLERRTSRAGRDTIDHGPGGHDDLINSVGGALVMAAKKKKQHDPRTLSFTGECKVPAHGNVGGSWANRL